MKYLMRKCCQITTDIAASGNKNSASANDFLQRKHTICKHSV